MISQLKQWFESLSNSEQRLLLVGGLLVFLALAWVGVYQPITQHIDQQVAFKNRLQNQLAQMQTMAGEVAPVQINQRQPIPANITFSSWVDQQLQVVNLQQMVNRTEPISESSLSVWLQGAPFNQVVDWLQFLFERYAVQVDQIDINVVDSDLGLTDIRMRLVK